MRALATLAMRTLSALANLIVDLACVPLRIAEVESRWVAGQQAHDPELHVSKRRTRVRT